LYGKNDKIQRTFSRFDDEAYSGRFRKDGTLLIAGDKSGYVRVFDTKTKAVLRYLKRHSNAVRATIWGTNALHFISGSDDATVKFWDLAGQEVTWSSDACQRGHSDYVRCLAANPAGNELFLSGSYDHTVKMWDTRQQEPVFNLPHGAPVESCLSAPSGSLIFTSAGNEVKIFDLVAGGKLLHTFSSHQKNITGLALDSTSTRLLSCALDGHIKFYNLQQLKVVHGIKVGAPIVRFYIFLPDIFVFLF
jgi:U3 small nucleolar RNA-associated protein 15